VDYGTRSSGIQGQSSGRCLEANAQAISLQLTKCTPATPNSPPKLRISANTKTLIYASRGKNQCDNFAESEINNTGVIESRCTR